MHKKATDIIKERQLFVLDYRSLLLAISNEIHKKDTMDINTTQLPNKNYLTIISFNEEPEVIIEINCKSPRAALRAGSFEALKMINPIINKYIFSHLKKKFKEIRMISKNIIEKEHKINLEKFSDLIVPRQIFLKENFNNFFTYGTFNQENLSNEEKMLFKNFAFFDNQPLFILFIYIGQKFLNKWIYEDPNPTSKWSFCSPLTIINLRNKKTSYPIPNGNVKSKEYLIKMN